MDFEIKNPDEKPLIVQHEEIIARAIELDKKFAGVVEAHGDLSEIEAALELINQEREILKEKKELRYAQVKEVLLTDLIVEKKVELLSVLKEDLMPFLIKALTDKDRGVRIGAAYALEKIGSNAKDAVPALIKALGDEADAVKGLAASTLGDIGPEAKDAVPALIKTLDDQDWMVRAFTAEALGNIRLKDPAAIKKLEEISIDISISEQDDAVKRRALEALNKLKGAS